MTWLTNFFDVLLSIIPRLYHVPVNKGGVLYGRNGKVKELLPGNRWWWPVLHSIETYPINRTTLRLPAQRLTNNLKASWAMRGIINYEVEDVVWAFVETYDIEDVIGDEAMCAIADKFSEREHWKLKDLNRAIAQLTKSRLEKYGVKVLKFRLVEYTPTRVISIFGDKEMTPVEEEEE